MQRIWNRNLIIGHIQTGWKQAAGCISIPIFCTFTFVLGSLPVQVGTLARQCKPYDYERFVQSERKTVYTVHNDFWFPEAIPDWFSEAIPEFFLGLIKMCWSKFCWRIWLYFVWLLYSTWKLQLWKSSMRKNQFLLMRFDSSCTFLMIINTRLEHRKYMRPTFFLYFWQFRNRHRQFKSMDAIKSLQGSTSSAPKQWKFNLCLPMVSFARKEIIENAAIETSLCQLAEKSLCQSAAQWLAKWPIGWRYFQQPDWTKMFSWKEEDTSIPVNAGLFMAFNHFGYKLMNDWKVEPDSASQ